VDLDFDDPEDAILVLAAIDEDDRAASGPGIPGTPGDPGVNRAGCGCGGCLLPALAMTVAMAVGFGAQPLAAILGVGALLLAVMDRQPHGG
jgi:hypothetical protein